MISAALEVGDLVQITYEPGIDADGSAGNEAYLSWAISLQLVPRTPSISAARLWSLTTRSAYQLKKRSWIPFPIE